MSTQSWLHEHHLDLQSDWLVCTATNETTDIKFVGQSIVGIEWTRVKKVAVVVLCGCLREGMDVYLIRTNVGIPTYYQPSRIDRKRCSF